MSEAQVLFSPSPRAPRPSPHPVRRILIMGHSNLGDAIMASPVIATLHERFPNAHLTLVAGQRVKALFEGDPRVRRFIEIESFGEGLGRARLVSLVWRLKPDVFIDLRQTVLPLVWKPWRLLRYFWPIPRDVRHMQDRHLWRMHRQLSSVLTHPRLPPHAYAAPMANGIHIDEATASYVERQLGRWGVATDRRLVLICPGARGSTRRWYPDRFAALADRLIEELNAEVVFTGEPADQEIVEDIRHGMTHRAHNLVGLTTIRQLAALMQRAALVIAQDSGSLHLAGAIRCRILALFGPSDPRKYGPRGPSDRVIQRRLFCVPCEVSLCRFNHECMRFISADGVFEAARQILGQGARDAQRRMKATR